MRRLAVQAGTHLSQIQGVDSHSFQRVPLRQENPRGHYDSLEDITNSIIQSLIAAIDKPFSDVDKGNAKASRVIDSSMWPA